MAISFDRALGIHPEALSVRSQRLELLASNLANADTPNYKARDIDFRAALRELAPGEQTLHLTRTHPMHIQDDSMAGSEILYRVPNQPSLDGNTVDPQLEQAAFAQNTIQYQASLEFLNSRFSGLRNALKGE